MCAELVYVGMQKEIQTQEFGIPGKRRENMKFEQLLATISKIGEIPGCRTQ